MSKAATLPSPVEKLQAETAKDEAELTKLREESEKAPETEELAEESLPSEDADESEAEDVPDQPSEAEEKPVVEDQEPEPSENLSNRAQERYRKLSEDKRLALEEAQKWREHAQNLQSVVEALQQQGYTKREAEQIAPQIDQQYIDPQQLQRDLARQAQAIVHQTLSEREMQQAQVQANERFQEDLKTIEEKHAILNEDSPEYSRKLSNFVADLYESRLAKNPKIRLTDVVNEVMELRSQAAEEASKKQVGKVARQASQQALSPSGGKTDIESLADKIKSVDSEADLAEIRKKLDIAE